MAAIFGRSQHPVLIKKIKINIWSLRDEIKTLIASRVHNEKQRGHEDIQISDIVRIYSPNSSNSTEAPQTEEAPTLEAVPAPPPADANGLLPEVQLDNSEDEMAKALREAENPPAPVEAAPNLNNDPTVSTNSTSNLPNSEENAPTPLIPDNVYLLKRAPQLPAEKIAKGVAILYDITFDKLHIFSTQNYIAGQTVVIEFLIPDSFCVTLEVLYCVKYNPSSRIISENKPSYRIVGKFLFMKKGERTKLRDFLKSIDANPDNSGESSGEPSGEGATDEVANILKEM